MRMAKGPAAIIAAAVIAPGGALPGLPPPSPAGGSVPVPGFRGDAIEVEATFELGNATTVGVGLDAWLMRYVLSWAPDRLTDIVQTYW